VTPILVKIADIAAVKGGKRLPKGEELTSLPTDNPYIRAQDIREGKITIDDPKFLTPEQHQRLKRYIVAAGDVCIVIVGANVGDVGIVPKQLHGANLTENAVKLTNFRHDCIPQYVNYCLSAPDAQAQMQQIAGGAAQPKLGIYKVLDVEIPFHPKNTQDRIASILSAYDDLIENNARRIKILEDMAQMLYREWFVNFRFPGHQKVKMVESELGPIPEAWELKRLEDVAEVNEISIKSSSAPERIRYIDIASVSTARIEKIESLNFGDAPGRARRIVRHGDIIWSTVRPNRRSYALIVNPEPHLIVSTGFAVLTAKAVPFSYLYLTVTTDEFADYLTNHATGSAYPAVTGKEFEQAQLVVPPTSLRDRFHEVTEPLLNLSWCLHQRNRNLRTTRDLVLPKLISGDIPIDAAAELVEQTA
jgi:type I restriction enzyme S subunit